jgi:hypothetical protein
MSAETPNPKNRGIVIPAMERYESLLIHNIGSLRSGLRCALPIEIWQIGQEISDEARTLLNQHQEDWNLVFKDVCDYTDDPEHWRGYQIKAFAVKHSDFDELILCDCDSLFLQNPEMLFDDPNYVRTGTFFFKDFLRHTPKSKEHEHARIKWFRSLMPKPSPYLPPECYYLYDIPPKVQQYWFYQESGMVYLNKKQLPDVIDAIYRLNNEHETTYQYVHGDKETFWIACLLCNSPFHMNRYPGINLYPDLNKPSTSTPKHLEPAFTHIYVKSDNTHILYYSQKAYPDMSRINQDAIMRQLS